MNVDHVAIQLGLLDNETMAEVLCSGDASREERSDACEVVEWWLWWESAGFLEALESVIIPQMERFRPQLLIISGTSQHVHPSIHSSIQPSHLFFLPPTHPSHLFIHPTIYPFIYSSIHPFIHKSIFSFIHLSTHFFIHLFIHGSYLQHVYVYVSSAAGFDGYTSDPLGGQLCLSLQEP
jgi:hypothetical protein